MNKEEFLIFRLNYTIDQKLSVHKSGVGSSSGRAKYHISKTKQGLTYEKEIEMLRARNEILEKTMKSIKDCANEIFDQKHELVWFAKNRCRLPNHEKSKRLESSEEYSDEINKLRSKDCDYFHGINCGVLATSRLFKDITDLTSSHEKDAPRVLEDHDEKIKRAKQCFPNLTVE